ncbi:MAG: hypothetical protein D6729_13045 [Deltaproteobacteria bacterium]|nr:MAG: hypothetical protein D6729_13045 [Deltaproteobacteria bacterium]
MRSTGHLLIAALVLGGCQCERFFPEKVGSGIARLTVRNVAVATKIIASDTECGFEAPDVKEAFLVDGRVGETGTVTWEIDDCTLDFGEVHTVFTDCNGIELRAGGTVTLSGTKSVTGLLTGELENPVIPQSPDAVHMELSMAAHDFVVEMSNKDTSLRIIEGNLSWNAEPHLGVADSSGVCSIVTSDLSLSSIGWKGGRVFVTTASSAFEADVVSSDIAAQIGRWGDHENWIDGRITVWDSSVEVPNGSDEFKGLDDAYDPATHLASFACTEDLRQPLSYECEPLTPKLAEGTARLGVKLFGRLASVLDDDARCGFANPDVLAEATLNGAVGEVGSATFTVTDCPLDFGGLVAVKEDCLGHIDYLSGSAVASGTKTVTGLLTGDPEVPVIPLSQYPGSATVRFEVSGLTLSDNATSRTLTVNGALSGTVATETAIDTQLGVCAYKTPHAAFDDIAIENSDVVLGTELGRFNLKVGTSQLDAQNGKKGMRENYLSGFVVMDGQRIDLPLPGKEPVLDPDYDPAAFEESYACDPRFEKVTAPEDCDFRSTLARGVARLLMQTAGSLGALINADDACGFESTGVLTNPIDVQGDPPQMGSVTWQTQGCVMESATEALVSSECTGGYTHWQGRATFDARRTVRGERVNRLGFIAAVIPRAHDAVDLFLDSVSLEGFSTWYVAPGEIAPEARLEFHSGTLSAILHPITGENANDPGVYDIPTPVLWFEDVRLQNADATLYAGGKTFRLALDSAQASGQNGSFGGRTNEVTATIEIDGTVYDLGTLPLKESYDQAAFDATYDCDPSLVAPVPAD